MTRARHLVFSALIAAGILWGTTVPLSKLALNWLPPTWLGLARFALAGAILMVASRGRLRAAASPAIVINGALGYGGSVVLQNFGVERTSVTHAALLIGTTPVLVAVIAAAWQRSVARPVAWAGFGLSLAGVAVIAVGKGGGASLGGDGLVLAGQLASAAFTASQSRLLPGRDPVAVTAVQLLSAAVFILPLALASSLLHGGVIQAARPTLTAVLATVALVVAGTVGPATLFAYGQSRVSADVAGAFLNLEPLVGAIMGTVVFADPVGLAQLAGGAAILTGIAMSSVAAMRASGSPPAPAAPSTAAAGNAPIVAPAPAMAVGVPFAPLASDHKAAATRVMVRHSVPPPGRRAHAPHRPIRPGSTRPERERSYAHGLGRTVHRIALQSDDRSLGRRAAIR